MAEQRSQEPALRGRKVGIGVAFSVLLGLLACADGLFANTPARPQLIQCGVLVIATIYLIAAFAVEKRWFVSAVASAMLSAAIMLIPGVRFSFSWAPFVVLSLCMAFAWAYFNIAVAGLFC